ncbi:hypothetical protein P5705_00025 [Pseudomonas entomophila]|uniref:hypothetical protein n=1 Tax=Pseudomonas entomophila TaxID=312306 RepID=UPI002405EF84|nr:hypothetical protein [Pseudomonas entomophila]MDF9616017.1 hypothetical protein [Pseudomonas entomophila]
MTSFEKISKKVRYSEMLAKVRAEVDSYNKNLRPSGIGIQADDTLNDFGLPNVLPPAADGKENLFPLSARVDGLLLTLANAWGDTEGKAGTFDIFVAYVNDVPVINGTEVVNGESFPYTYRFNYPTQDSDIPGAFIIPYTSLRVGGDGLKVIHYTVVNTDTGNSNSSPKQIVTLDLIDPAEGANPDALEFVDAAKNGVFDLRYLEDNDGFEVNAIRPVDYFPGDTFQIYVVGHATPLLAGNVPPGDAGDPFLVRIDMATIRSGLPEGYTGKLVVRFTDRAGNRTDSSIEVDVTISLVQAPENLLAPVMASPVFIPDRDRGVEGIVPANATLRNGDVIKMTLDLNGVVARRQFSWPLDRATFSGADFGAIGSPLTNATLDYEVQREGTVPVKPNNPTVVVVDLSQLVVDPTTLTPPAAVGRPSGVTGFIRPGDNAFWILTPIDLTAAGHVYELWYGNPTNTFTYTIAGNEPGPTIEVPIPQAFLENGSNGTVAIGYRVRESATTGNFQDAPNGSVEVTFLTIGITTLANFTGRVGGTTQEPGPGAALGRLNCQGVEPIQNGVSLQIREPVGILHERDDITVTLTLSRDDFGTTPLSTNTHSLNVTVDATQARTGLITLSRELLPRAFFEDPAAPGSHITRGSIIAQWNIKRATGNLEEDSRPSAVRYVLTLNGGANCLPAA